MCYRLLTKRTSGESGKDHTLAFISIGPLAGMWAPGMITLLYVQVTMTVVSMGTTLSLNSAISVSSTRQNLCRGIKANFECERGRITLQHFDDPNIFYARKLLTNCRQNAGALCASIQGPLLLMYPQMYTNAGIAAARLPPTSSPPKNPARETLGAIHI